MFCCLAREPSSASVPGVLDAVARACSPRVESYGSDAVVFDVRGLQRVLGPPSVIAAEVMRLTAARGVVARMALAGTMTAAWLLTQARPGTTIARPGEDAVALAGLPLERLRMLPEVDEGDARACVRIFDRWGLRTLGDVARLPRADVRARLGDVGVRLHQAACGEDVLPLVPAEVPRRFAERLELEWPLEELEPLSFVLARLCDGLSASLERADRGAVAITTRLRLVTRQTHERVLQVPAPLRDGRVLRTLILLDLESHPPPAAVDSVEVELSVTPGRIVQGSLLTQALPSSDHLATLVARVSALMGASRVGAPVLVDTSDARAVGMRAFSPASSAGTRPRRLEPVEGRNAGPDLCLRRCRPPISAHVTVERGMPLRVVPGAHGWAGGRVIASAGPWRTSGRWWALDRTDWDRDEWDVELADGAMYRIARNRKTGQWEIEGVVD